MKSTSKCAPSIRGEIKKARNSNYDFFSGLAEFVDNAIDAEATHIRIEIRERSGGGSIHKIVISDNADRGIPWDHILSIFSWTFERPRSLDTIGEFGTGFKTAAVNIGEKLTVYSVCSSTNRYHQATADWEDMALDNRWEPRIMEISPDLYADMHPFRRGTTFILEGIRNEILPEPWLKDLLRRTFDEMVYLYRYLLWNRPTLQMSFRGLWDPQQEITDRDFRSHPLFTDPLQNPVPRMNNFPLYTLRTILRVYYDRCRFCRIVFTTTPQSLAQHDMAAPFAWISSDDSVSSSSTIRWEYVEYIDRRKNGNSIVRVHDMPASALETFELVDTLVFDTLFVCDRDHHMTCTPLYSDGSLDILREGRVMARDIFLRALRPDPFHGFLKHELWFHHYAISPLLNIQYNKQNTGVLRDNSMRYTLEYIQQRHERELVRVDREWMSSLTRRPHDNNPNKSTSSATICAMMTIEPPPQSHVSEDSSSSSVDTTMAQARKSFTPNTKLRVLHHQESRDCVFDFLLKDHVLLFEYDHKDNTPANNHETNCQILSVITHSLKTRCPETFETIASGDPKTKTKFIVELLNCLTCSQYFWKAYQAGQIRFRNPHDSSACFAREGAIEWTWSS